MTWTVLLLRVVLLSAMNWELIFHNKHDGWQAKALGKGLCGFGATLLLPILYPGGLGGVSTAHRPCILVNQNGPSLLCYETVLQLFPKRLYFLATGKSW